MNRQGGERRVTQIADWHQAKWFSLMQLCLIIGSVVSAVYWFARFEASVEQSAIETNNKVYSAEQTLVRHDSEIRQLREAQVVRDTAMSSKLTAMRMEQKADLERETNKLGNKLDRIEDYLRNLNKGN